MGSSDHGESHLDVDRVFLGDIVVDLLLMFPRFMSLGMSAIVRMIIFAVLSGFAVGTAAKILPSMLQAETTPVDLDA